MQIRIKAMETDAEILGKAFVHWQCWHDSYPGMVRQDYLDRLTLEKCEQMAFQWRDNQLVAMDGDRVIGFIGYGVREQVQNVGEVFALYVLSEYRGTGAAKQLMDAALLKLSAYESVCVRVLKQNARAIRFYEKCGFRPTGEEEALPRLDTVEILMLRKKDANR